MSAESGSGPRTVVFRGTFFQLQLPDHWEHEIVENIPAFFDPDGNGVLQIAATRSPSGAYDIAEQMRTYLEQNRLEFLEDRVMSFERPDGARCLACEFVRDNRFWLVHMIALGSRLLIVLYNADQVPDAASIREVVGVIQSVQFLVEEATES
ncbi:MAG: hypothetical protein KDK27_10600 [Leptospiraceae bacterium]|nr:hypothetical protein [Leptospiraceae bacterium]